MNPSDAIEAIEKPFGGKTSIFSHSVYLFLREFSLQDSRGGSGISSAGFLLADNPLGKSNANDLMRIQTQMAKAYKIQLIYLTGISDENAQSMFDNHLFLNKVQKLRRRDLVTVDKERHALWAASLAGKPQFDPVI
ncbi:hypothetical protein [Escherichia coli]|uniref:hypothetical protein n=1 Tax=Escherichia coli TaxID=562 RepID=UPI00288307C9|nr:hypothetical protein [Escherichia coli]